jgi:EmrB/QacA subfamily drug resistance transporter
MVNIALPTIMKSFQSPLKSTQWVVLIYLLTITSSLLLWGSLADRVGRKKIYSCGLFIFAVGSLACAYSPSLVLLILARFIQALGAAMMMATGPAIIKDNFPPEQLGRGLGMIGIAVSLGLMTGPAIGGGLLQFYSWRSIFLVTVPIGLLFSTFAWKIIPAPKELHHQATIHWKSGLCWIIVLISLSYSITYAASPSWSGQILAALCLGVLFSVLVFSVFEYKARTPLLPMYLFRKRYFSTAVACAVLSFMVLFSVLILLPFYLDLILELPKSSIGLVMMSVPAAVLVVAPAAGWMAEAVSARILCTSGLMLSTAALFWLTTINNDSAISAIIAPLVLLGSGQALFLSPNSAAVLHRVSSKDSGKSAAILATARNLGMLLGIGQSSLVFAFCFSKLTAGLDVKDFSAVHTPSFITALQASFTMAALTGCFGILISLFRGPQKPGEYLIKN